MNELAKELLELLAAIVLLSLVGGFVTAWDEDRKWRKRNERKHQPLSEEVR